MLRKKSPTAVIIGAGPAGLTAALELLRTTDIYPVILEASQHTGGISRTEDFQGNRMDIGGHRFFTKSRRILDWWLDMLPLQGAPARDDILNQRDMSTVLSPGGPNPETRDRVMLLRSRSSSIYHRGSFFPYPLTLNPHTLMSLDPARLARIGLSYLRARLMPVRPEKNLEDFFINRFGRELYLTFFKEYTHKVWGVPCSQIPPRWGVQRIKGLSVSRAVLHALRSGTAAKAENKNTETSLIEQFYYPKLGPGQLWEETARRILELGGDIRCGHRVVSMETANNRITRVTALDQNSFAHFIQADYVLSSMPVPQLVSALPRVPEHISRLARGLPFRDFLTVGILARRLTLEHSAHPPAPGGLIPDNWIYIQDQRVRMGRIQIFNNWSPYLVHDPGLVWLGLEYFCNRGDALWKMSDSRLIRMATQELQCLGFVGQGDALDGTVIRQLRAYPAYLGTFERFSVVRNYLEGLDNLMLMGRNGMHRYNNMDHSMLTAMAAVDGLRGQGAKNAAWKINSEEKYHEHSSG